MLNWKVKNEVYTDCWVFPARTTIRLLDIRCAIQTRHGCVGVPYKQGSILK